MSQVTCKASSWLINWKKKTWKAGGHKNDIHTLNIYFNLKHINWHSFTNLQCKAKIFSLNWHCVLSLIINHTLNVSLKISSFSFFTLEQELKWLPKHGDWRIFLDCYSFSLNPSPFIQRLLTPWFLYIFNGVLTSNHSEEFNSFFIKTSLLVHSYFISCICLIYVGLIYVYNNCNNDNSNI